MGKHKERAHALLSPSGAHRWLNCPPSARLEESFPDSTSEAAEEGTLAHEVAELKLRHYFTTEINRNTYTRRLNKLKKNEKWQSEMDEHTDTYLDYLKGIALGLKTAPSVAIEKKVDYSMYAPEGSGIADCIMVYGEVLHVTDFKYGKSPDGRVGAENNPQLMLYALGAYEAYKILYPIKAIVLTVVQPRLPDGISDWSCSLEELLQFGEKAKGIAALAFKGEGEFHPDVKTCRFCRARSQCRARADENVRMAFMIDKKPPLITNEEAGSYLYQGQDVAKWLKDLQEYALKECLAGKEVPGWKAVEGKISRAWTDMDTAFETLESSGIDEAVLYKREPLTLAQVEKVIGKKDFQELVGTMVVKNPGKPTLAKESDKREAITNQVDAKEVFKNEISQNENISECYNEIALEDLIPPRKGVSYWLNELKNKYTEEVIREAYKAIEEAV